jgi:tetratricopeptide (TPR) repeat protein
LDSQGDVNLILGHLPEAENLYLEASRKDPNFLGSLDLLKAAYARLVSGDIAGADGLFARYVQARAAAKDPLLPYRQAEWDWVAGRRKPAIARLEEIARANESGAGREQASRAYTELALWHLALGNRETAASMGGRAIAASLPANGASAYFARFLAQPDASPAEWETRAGRFFQNPAVSQLKQFALACALLYGKHFEAAVPVVQQVEQAGSIANDPILPVLRAWTLVETSHPSEAASFLRWNPVPPPTGFGGFWTLGFPRIFYLRAALATSQGKPDEAKAQYRLFLQLSGPDPLQWGEEKKAKAAM